MIAFRSDWLSLIFSSFCFKPIMFILFFHIRIIQHQFHVQPKIALREFDETSEEIYSSEERLFDQFAKHLINLERSNRREEDY